MTGDEPAFITSRWVSAFKRACQTFATGSDEAYTQRLDKLLAQKALRPRIAERQKLNRVFTWHTCVWGKTQEWRPELYLAICYLLVITFTGYWWRPSFMPRINIALDTLLAVGIVFGLPAYARHVRKKDLLKRVPVDDPTCATALRSLCPAVPEEFTLAARRALAAGYCVEAELLDPMDTQARCRRLSLLGGPLLVEVLAQTCRELDLTVTPAQLRAAAKQYRARRPATVAEVIGALYEQFLETTALDERRHHP